MVRPVYDAVFERTGIGPGTRYLDLGCGAGMAAQVAAGRGAKVSGLDAAEALLAIARDRVPEGDFHHGDLEDLPFEDESFDVVTGFNSIQYAGNPVVALREARRVVRAYGAVAVVTWGDPVGMEAAALVTALGALCHRRHREPLGHWPCRMKRHFAS
jgi:ubiquinone/menaquinone biosynthesis C-methylase UbiE